MTILHRASTAACLFPCLVQASMLSVLLLGMAGCSKTQTAPSACIDGDDNCGVACNSSHPCPSGLYCGTGQLCAKACTADQGCASDQHCGGDGQCLAGAARSKLPPSSRMGDAGATGGTGSSSGFVLDAGTNLTPTETETCQAADVSAARVIPNVVLVIDQSASMRQDFGDAGTRWDVLRDFLLKPDGLIAMFETQVRFGLALYTAVEYEVDGGVPECPIVTSVAPKLMNHDAISRTYNSAGPLGDTPTGDAIDKIVDGLPTAQLDMDGAPTVLILATDGEPDRCEELNPQRGQAEAIAAVERAYSLGIRTYIISVGDEVSAQHQQAVANAGLGRLANDAPAPYWQAGDDASLRAALTEIIGAQVSCEVSLEGSVQSGDPCLGKVELNGAELDCKGQDGWELVDPKHIRLLGQACTDWKTLRNAAVHARFPCDVEIVF